MKFYIEHFEKLREGYGWVRIPGATATKLRDAEELKIAEAKANREPLGNYSIMCEVDEDLRGRV